MVLLALLFILCLVVEAVPGVSPNARVWASYLDWAIWGVFALEYLLMVALANHKALYIRTHLLDLAMVVLPALRLLRILRLLRLLRIASVLMASLRQFRDVQAMAARRGVTGILSGILSLLLVGAFCVYHVEGPTNGAFSTFGDSLWWAFVTASTVGYGDAVPHTLAGRAVAAFLMLLGLVLFGVMSATVVASFMAADEEEQRGEMQHLEAALADVSQRLEELTDQIQQLRSKENVI